MRDFLFCESLDINDGVAFERQLGLWVSKHGPIAHLVSAAGILEPGRCLDAPRESFRRVIETNFLANLDGSISVRRHMAAMRKGSIVTIASNSATSARMGLGS